MELVKVRKLSLFGGSDSRIRYHSNKLLFNEKRNGSCRFYSERILEPAFVEMLIPFYTDQAGEVVKYLKKAGYTDEEIGELINGL